MLSIENVNLLDYSDFKDKFGSVIEHCPFVAAGVWSSHPFLNRESLHSAFGTFLGALNKTTKLRVVRCHPDLAGKLAAEKLLSDESAREHKSAGLLSLSVDEKRSLTELNQTYKEKFQFPFILCVRENKKESIFREIRKRVNNDVESELENALAEVCKIAWYRIADLVKDTSNL